MKVKAIIERGSDGTYGIYVQNNPLPFGIIGDGKTVDEAIEDFKNSIGEMRIYYQEQGRSFPEFMVEYE